MRRQLVALVTAVGFLSRLPVPAGVGWQGKLHHAVPYFPLVGFLEGGILAALALALRDHLPPALLGVLLTAAGLVFTGGLHLDGLMDTADGLLSGRPRERALEIMRDSRVGAMGAMTGVMVLMLKAASLASLTSSWPLLLLVPALARWGMLTGLLLFPYGRAEGLGAYFAGRRPWSLVAAGSYTLLAAYLLLGLQGVALWTAPALMSVVVSKHVTSRLGGLTGDVYGALVEIGETLILFLALVR